MNELNHTNHIHHHHHRDHHEDDTYDVFKVAVHGLDKAVDKLQDCKFILMVHSSVSESVHQQPYMLREREQRAQRERAESTQIHTSSLSTPTMKNREAYLR